MFCPLVLPPDCPECYRLIQIEVKKLRKEIFKLNDTVKRVKNGQIGDATFEMRFNNARRSIQDLWDKANNSTVREDEVRLDLKELNETLKQLEEDLNKNVKPVQKSLEQDVSDLKQRRGNVSVLMNKTEVVVEESYRLLVESVGPGATKAHNLSAYLGSLTPTFSQLVENFTNLAEQQNRTSHEIVANASKIDSLVRDAENMSTRADGDLKVVTQMIEKLERDAENTKEVGLKVNVSASELYMNASSVLARVLETRDAVRHLQPNNSKHVSDVATAAARASAHAQTLIKRRENLTQEYASQISEVQDAASNTTGLKKRVREAERRGLAILDESRRAKGEAHAAVTLANKTHSDSKEMLSILRNFTKKADESKQLAAKALLRAQEVNATSWKAIQFADKLNVSLQFTHFNASEAQRKAERARDISKIENEVRALYICRDIW